MSPDRSSGSREPIRRSTGWVGRGSRESGWPRALGLIAIGALGIGSFTPFYEPDAERRGWDWLPYLGLAIWLGFLAVGTFRLVRSFKRRSAP